MANHVKGSDFAKAIRSAGALLSDRQLRKFLFNYCRRYQEVYWFDALENAFVCLELTLAESSDALQSEMGAAKSDVQEAMGEYCESLNEFAIALHRLFDDAPLTVTDAIQVVGHIWNAYTCNESPDEFVEREDAVLCGMLESLVKRPTE